MRARRRQLLATGVMLALLLAATAGASGSPAAPPRAGAARVCGASNWRHGAADIVHLRGVGCARAKRIVRYALNHGAARPRLGRGFVTSPPAVHGLSLLLPDGHVQHDDRNGPANITFYLCWFNVNC